MRLARRVEQLPPYLFMTISRLIQEQSARGVDVISFGIGDPDLPTPQHILDSLKRAVDDPANHRYPESDGLPELRASIAHWYRRRHGVELDPATEIVPLIGSKEGIGHLPLCLLDPGDVALITDPGYPVYEIGAMFAGGEAVKLPLREQDGWLPRLDEVPEESARRARILWLNYPNNPTGATASLEFFESAVRWARDHDVVIAHDLAYADVTYDGYVAPSLLEVDGARRWRSSSFALEGVQYDRLADRHGGRERCGDRRPDEAQVKPRQRHPAGDPADGDHRAGGAVGGDRAT